MPEQAPIQQTSATGDKFYETTDTAGKVTQHAGVAPFAESELVNTITEQNNAGVVSGTDTNRDIRGEELDSYMKDLQVKGASLTGGFTSDADKNEIEAAREAARLATQGMVEGAQESRRTVLPSEVVRAGSRGGFESTQMAGAAATRATDPKTGEAFVGAGGQLDETRQDLDRAVIAAKRAQQQAMAQAAAAAKTAIRTRRSDDYKVAKDLYDVSNQAAQYADEVERDQRDFDQRAKQFEATEKRAIAQDERMEAEAARQETEFIQRNEDRIAKAYATSLLDLDENSEVIFPEFEDIKTLAEENGVPVAVMTAAINERTDALNKIGKEKRAEQLNKDKFEETKAQNEIRNEMEQQRIGISAGHLALAQEKDTRISGVSGTLPDKFFASARNEVEGLKKGEEWGTVWNRLKQQFPDATDEQIDTALGGAWKEGTATGWAEEGAFEEFKEKQYKQEKPAEYERQAGIWRWLASEEADGLSNSQKKKQIMAAGFDPNDFMLY